MSTGTLFRLATAGSVDDGKSTLVGRLLHDAQALLSDQIAAVERTSAERNFGAGNTDGLGTQKAQQLDLALVTDGLRAEREQGITIDVAYRYFATDRRSFVLADCPGHVQYTRNTVTGASTADAVVLLVDIRHGVVEQTRRHLAVATLLGVEHIIIAVNKIDAVGYSEEPFRTVEADIHRVVAELGRIRQAEAPIVIPVSALNGDNVVTVSDRTPWYSGQALLPILEQLPDANAALRTGEPLRVPIQTVIRPHQDFRGYTGQIYSGELRPGDSVRVQPGSHITTVTAVDRTPLQQLTSSGDSALAGESVTIQLTDDIDIARGHLLTDPNQPAQELDTVTVQVAWLAEKPLHAGARLLFKHGTATVKALVTEVKDTLDLTSLAPLSAEALELNDIGTVTIRLASALPVDDYTQLKRTGSALIIDPDSGNTLAAAMIQLPDTPGHERK